MAIKTVEKEVPDKILQKGDKTLKIYRDMNSENPRTWGSNVGIIAEWHPDYDLGDREITGPGDEELPEDVVAELPVYLYDHSGLRMKVGSFQGQLPQGHARFDSGQVGYIYTTEEQMDKLGIEEEDRTKENIRKWLKEEVEQMDQYVSGDVWRYNLYEDGELVDSCTGFYGMNFDENGLFDEAGVSDSTDWEEISREKYQREKDKLKKEVT